MITLNKEQWLKEMPELIYNLKFKYNFYFSGFYTHITKDILEIIKNPKNKHKISIYNKDNRFFLVVYSSRGADIYYTSEYRNDKNTNRIRYFMQKFNKSYKKAEVDWEWTWNVLM